MTQLALIPFLLISFAIAWGIIGVYIFLSEPMIQLFGALSGAHPLFYVAVYAPAIAAIIAVLYTEGTSGLRRFISRLLLWRTSIGWYALMIIGIPLVFYAAAALQGRRFTDLLPFPSVPDYLMAAFLMAVKGPVEEIGWRGLALPLLQRRFSPLWASLILGVIWGIWHLPAFLLSGTPQSAWAFTPFFVGAVAISVIVTPMFNQSCGSILLPALFHFQLINPLWPDAQPHDTYLFVAGAALVVFFNRNTMLMREGAVTEVIPKAKQPPPESWRPSSVGLR
jgi:uncharacterized protein